MLSKDHIDITANLARRVKTLRKLHKWTGEELAHKAGITPAYMSIIENNKAKNVSLVIVYRIAQAFAVPVSDLIQDI